VLGRELARRSLRLSVVCVCGLAFLPPKEVTKRSSSYGILEKRSWVVVEKLALEKLHYCLPSFAKFRPQGKEPEWAMGRTGWGGSSTGALCIGFTLVYINSLGVPVCDVTFCCIIIFYVFVAEPAIEKSIFVWN